MSLGSMAGGWRSGFNACPLRPFFMAPSFKLIHYPAASGVDLGESLARTVCETGTREVMNDSGLVVRPRED